MTEVSLILDADALLAYARGSERIGTLIAESADDGKSVLIPATSLADAYRRVDSDGLRYLDIISTLSWVDIVPLDRELCPFVGGWARKLGLELAHAAIEASSHPMTPFLTSRRELVTEHLAKEWPIIDL
jgi:hypothetical protein